MTNLPPIPPAPPRPPSLQSPPSISTLRGLFKRRFALDQDIYNVAKAMLVPGVQLIYHRNAEPASHSARVIEVTGEPGKVRLLVEKMNSKKRVYINLNEITGIVQES